MVLATTASSVPACARLPAADARIAPDGEILLEGEMFLGTIGVYAQVRHYRYIDYDDDRHVRENQYV